MTNPTAKEARFDECYSTAASVDVPVTCNGYSVRSIRSFAFRKSCQSVTLHEGLTKIDAAAFDRAMIETLTIPASVKELGNLSLVKQGLYGYESIFVHDKKNLDEVVLKSIEVASGNPNYQSINGVLFSKDGKTLLNYPPASTAISYTVPEGVTTICPIAFSCAKNLETVTLPKSLKALQVSPDPLTGASKVYPGCTAFEKCVNLKAINVSSGNTVYKSIDGVLFSANGMQLLRFPNNKQAATYSVPSGTEIIAEAAFYDATGVEEVRLPSGAKTIVDNAFYGATVGKLYLPNSVTSIFVSHKIHQPDTSWYHDIALTLQSTPQATLINEINQYNNDVDSWGGGEEWKIHYTTID